MKIIEVVGLLIENNEIIDDKNKELLKVYLVYNKNFYYFLTHLLKK